MYRSSARCGFRPSRACRSHRSAQRSEDQGQFPVSMIASHWSMGQPVPAPQVMSPSPALSSFFSSAGPAAPAGAGARPGAARRGKVGGRRLQRLRKEDGLRGLGVCAAAGIDPAGKSAQPSHNGPRRRGQGLAAVKVVGKKPSMRRYEAHGNIPCGRPLRGQGHPAVGRPGRRELAMELAIDRQPLERAPAVHPGREDGPGARARVLQAHARPPLLR
jgi:hypothetical protein